MTKQSLYNKRWLAKPGNKERQQAFSRKASQRYRKQNKEKVNLLNREYRKRNRAKFTLLDKQYRRSVKQRELKKAQALLEWARS